MARILEPTFCFLFAYSGGSAFGRDLAFVSGVLARLPERMLDSLPEWSAISRTRVP